MSSSKRVRLSPNEPVASRGNGNSTQLRLSFGPAGQFMGLSRQHEQTNQSNLSKSPHSPPDHPPVTRDSDDAKRQVSTSKVNKNNKAKGTPQTKTKSNLSLRSPPKKSIPLKNTSEVCEVSAAAQPRKNIIHALTIDKQQTKSNSKKREINTADLQSNKSNSTKRSKNEGGRTIKMNETTKRNKIKNNKKKATHTDKTCEISEQESKNIVQGVADEGTSKSKANIESKKGSKKFKQAKKKRGTVLSTDENSLETHRNPFEDFSFSDRVTTYPSLPITREQLQVEPFQARAPTFSNKLLSTATPTATNQGPDIYTTSPENKSGTHTQPTVNIDSEATDSDKVNCKTAELSTDLLLLPGSHLNMKSAPMRPIEMSKSDQPSQISSMQVVTDPHSEHDGLTISDDTEALGVDEKNSDVLELGSNDTKALVTEDTNVRQEIEPVNEYEMIRLKTIRQNQAFLLSLGLENTASNVDKNTGAAVSVKKGKKVKKAKTHAAVAAAALPPRRSSRIRNTEDAPTQSNLNDKTSTTEAESYTATASREEQQRAYEPSGLMQFVRSGGRLQTENTSDDCSKNGISLASHDSGSSWWRPSKKINSLERVNCKKVYHMDWHPDGTLLAVGGAQGQVTVYPVCQESNKNDEEEENTPATLAFSASRSWVSSVRFVPMLANANNVAATTDTASTASGVVDFSALLLTSANDGVVKVWDLAQSDVSSGEPKCLDANTDLHSSGVFSMDVTAVLNSSNDVSVATSSKDGTVVVSKLDIASKLGMSIVFDESHSGVVKCVRWCKSNNNLLASAGNDRQACIYDVRAGGKCVTSLISSEPTCLNSVQFHPTKEHIVMVSGSSTAIEIFDTRFPKDYTHHTSLVGHCKTGRRNVTGIYHPLFVGQGYNTVLSTCPGTTYMTSFSLPGGAISGVIDVDASYTTVALAPDQFASNHSSESVCCHVLALADSYGVDFVDVTL